ncbi:SOUL heme-binding family protein [Euphorbia peplus]|nr:SOUL heme-binding family protein [Euphorbia peplus]
MSSGLKTGIRKLAVVLWSLLSTSNLGFWDIEKPESIGIYPPTCNRIECPSFDVLQSGNGFEIRRYNSSVWISTSPIHDISLVQATKSAFFLLFDYIQGKNEYGEKIEMTGPVIAQVLPSDGPLCESSFTVSFYVPKKNQAKPPPAEGLHVQTWKNTYVAIRQFSGFVTDYNVGEEAAALQASLAGTQWAAAIDKSRQAGAVSSSSVYTVAQYNSPFEYDHRVNEIWMLFDMDD